MRYRNHIVLGCLLSVSGMGASMADIIEGKVVRVGDGDTCIVQAEKGASERIRFLAIDAPELKQAFGTQSKKNLEQLILGKTVKVEFNRRDQYGRITGKVMLDKEDINLAQIKAGYAWHYKTFMRQQTPEDAKAYTAAENEARQKQIGLWSSTRPQAPWSFRQENGTRR